MPALSYAKICSLILQISFFLSALYGSELGFKTYTKSSGLSSNYIFDLFQDRAGYIWIATDQGVNRFDGTRFETFTKTDGLNGNLIYKIFQDLEGGLWFGTFQNGAVRFADNHFSALSVEDGLPDATVTDIAQDTQGRLYFMTNNGLAVFGDTLLAVYKNSDSVPGNLFIHPNGTLFFNLNHALYYMFTGGENLPEPKKVALPP